MQHRQHSGFTIVELIVVIVVIAILASISYVTYAGIQDRAVNTVLQSGLRNANTQVQLATVDGENTACSSLKANDNTTYQCTPDPIAPGSDYCITVTSTNRPGAGTFRLDQNGAIQSGACPGHSSTGTPVVVATDASCFVTRDVTSSTVAITEYRGGGWESSGYRTVPYLSECPADVVIPSQIGGKTVVRLESTGSYGGDYYKFMGGFTQRYLSSAVIPDTVTSIGDGTFQSYYPSEFEITIPNSVTSIGRLAFGDVPLCRIPIGKINLLEDAGCSDTQGYNP